MSNLAAMATAMTGLPNHPALKYRTSLATPLATVTALALATNSDLAKLRNGLAPAGPLREKFVWSLCVLNGIWPVENPYVFVWVFFFNLLSEASCILM